MSQRVLNVVGGIGTIVGSLIGPIAVSLALPPVLLTAGPGAGGQSLRYRSVYLPVAAGLLIALFASTAADLAVLVPPTLLLAMAGLALVGALVGALKEITHGPLVLGPMFAFAIALSDMTLFGLGPFFWSLVIGTIISLLLERDGWKRLRAEVAEARGTVSARGVRSGVAVIFRELQRLKLLLGPRGDDDQHDREED